MDNNSKDRIDDVNKPKVGLDNKNINQLYTYTNPQNFNPNNQVNKYNYGNSYNYSGNNNYFTEGNRFDKKFILILCSCALLACILIGITGFGLYSFVANSQTNNFGSSNDNNNNFDNTPFNQIIDTSKVNYDNFAKITSSSSLNDVKDLLQVNPTSKALSDKLTQYIFAETIAVTYDDNGTLIDKMIYSYCVDFPNSVSKVDFDEFQKLKPKMSLSDIESVLGSKGVLTESTYKSVEGYFFAGDSYTWPTDKKGFSETPYVICDFDSDKNLVRAQNYDSNILPDPDEVNIDKEVINRFNDINLGTSFKEVETSFKSKLIMEDIGIPENYMISYYHEFENATVMFVFDEDNKLITKWISSREYDFYDANAKDSSKINELMQGMSYKEIKDILGVNGYLCYDSSYEDPIKSYAWVFDDGNCIVIDFDFSTSDGKAYQIIEY